MGAAAEKLKREERGLAEYLKGLSLGALREGIRQIGGYCEVHS